MATRSIANRSERATAHTFPKIVRHYKAVRDNTMEGGYAIVETDRKQEREVTEILRTFLAVHSLCDQINGLVHVGDIARLTDSAVDRTYALLDSLGSASA